MSFRPIYAKRSKSLLKQTTTLNNLVDTALLLGQLQDCLNQYLPVIMRENCAVASFKNRMLTILTTQAHWATRLRYQQQHLKHQLSKHSEFYGVEKIVVKVSPKPYKKVEEVHHLTMSSQTAKVIAETADHIDHPALKAALARLASHSR